MEEYQSKFLDDALDLLADIEKTLLQLERAPENASLIEEVFRVMHTIKGAANMFGFEVVGRLTHQVEHVYDAIRNKQYRVNEEVLALTLDAVDHLRNLLDDHSLAKRENREHHASIEARIDKILASITKEEKHFFIQEELSAGSSACTYYLILRPLEPGVVDNSTLAHLLAELSEIGACKITPHGVRETAAGVYEFSSHCYWDVHIATERGKEAIEGIFLFVDDQFTVEIFEVANIDLLHHQEFHEKIDLSTENGEDLDLEKLQQYVHDLLEIIRAKEVKLLSVSEPSAAEPGNEKMSSTLKVSREKVNLMMDWVSELVTLQGALKEIARKHDIAELSSLAEKVDLLTGGLRSTVFSISLIPIRSLLNHFNRLVRDLSKSLGKEVEFRMEGADTEIDKKIIDQLTDPLLHILRNSLDHGIEHPELRMLQGKDPKGSIVLKSFYSGRHVVLQISDDGGGISLDAVRQKAIEKGLIPPGASLSEQEVMQLIFAPGFSTAKEVTTVSGRGVGMDVVRKKLEEVKGAIEIQSQEGRGTTISIRLPLTLSIIDGLLVQSGNVKLVVPMAAIHQCYRVSAAEWNGYSRFNAALNVEDKQLTVIHGRDIFPCNSAAPALYTVLTIIYEGQEIGLVVDKVIGEQQVVLKPLGAAYSQQDFLSGASILGDGSLALILDVEKLMGKYKKAALTY